MSRAPARNPAIDTTDTQGGAPHGAAKHGGRAVGSERPMGLAPRTARVLVGSAREDPVGVAVEERGFMVVRGRHGAGGGAGVSNEGEGLPGTVILDGARVPDMEALDLARKLRQAVAQALTPIFIIAPSPPTVPEHRAALRAGVCEFLVEPLDGDELAAKLARRLLARDATAGAAVDPATGLYDVQGLARCARDLTRRAFNHRAPLACVVPAPEVTDADPDDAAATLVMARVAKALKASGRQSDAFGRIGPNEFAIIAPGSDAQGAMTLAARLLQAAEGVTGEPGHPAPRMRLHAGYDAVSNARYAPLGPEDLLARAVRALRRARAPGAPPGAPPHRKAGAAAPQPSPPPPTPPERKRAPGAFSPTPPSHC